MAKESGVAQAGLSVDDAAGVAQDIRNDVTNWDTSLPRGVQDSTGVDRAAIERILLLADMSTNLNGIFNDAAGASHSVFRTVPSTSVARTVALDVSGQTLSAEQLFTDYALTRSNSGELTWTAPGVLADGVVPTWGP